MTPSRRTRREQILDTAADLFARRGFHGVSVVDLGAACGISGPALYKHFPSKDAMLAEMLVSVSADLLRAGLATVAAGGGLPALVDAHVDFALARPALIVVQDRDWGALPAAARETVRRLQREYVDLWVTALRHDRPDLAARAAAARVHAAFGLVNSTPHSALLPTSEMRRLLRTMTLAALAAGPTPPDRVVSDRSGPGR